ncbi:MAG: tRNA/rRNA methyltransferase [Parcubacteria group bacterium GW2011_GWC2_45_7]|nr:MAG: tRNA/rRNA methyltransferase [Parcubacteria group bacterium GW2011_GWC2_45_7]KKU73829.1 MAG: tRNA/rRNA methyltransferase [Parcubacteria group bacterium GW2011_GWA2_47_26]
MASDIYLIIDRVRSLYNVGSIFRTADAFCVKKIYLCGYTGVPPRKEISKVALGAEETVPWEKRGQTWRLAKELQEQGVYVVALENNIAAGFCPPCGILKASVTLLHKWRPRFPLALIVGNEVNGVARGVLERADAIVHIPMLGTKESLNVSVAAGIALYTLRYPNFSPPSRASG